MPSALDRMACCELPDSVLLHVALPKACNTQQNTLGDATPDATAMQQPTLKALVQRVLACNTARNTYATASQKTCNNSCNTDGSLVALHDERRHCAA
jgi:hypothetical protein